jgi:tetratricopeptide (TPR) repeat protein
VVLCLQLYRDLAKELPGDPRAQLDLARGLTQMGTLQNESGDYRTAAATLAEALEVADRAGRLDPRLPLLQPTRVAVRTLLGRSLEGLQQYGAAERVYRDAYPDAVATATANLDHTAHVRSLAEVTRRLGSLLLRQGRAAEAKPFLQQSARAQQLVYARGKQNAAYAWVLGLILYDLAVAHLSLGDYRATAEAADRLALVALEVQPNPTAPGQTWCKGFLYQAGKIYCACGKLARKDAKLAEGERSQVADGYDRQTVTALGRALERGWHPATPLDQDREFAPLWRRQDFQNLTSRRPAAVR